MNLFAIIVETMKSQNFKVEDIIMIKMEIEFLGVDDVWSVKKHLQQV